MSASALLLDSRMGMKGGSIFPYDVEYGVVRRMRDDLERGLWKGRYSKRIKNDEWEEISSEDTPAILL